MMRYLEMRLLVQMMRSLVEEMKLAEMMRFLATITLVVMPTSLVRKENTELVKEVAHILSYLLFSLESSLYFDICDDIQINFHCPGPCLYILMARSYPNTCSMFA